MRVWKKIYIPYYTPEPEREFKRKDGTTMTGKEFKKIRRTFGLSQEAMGRTLAVPPARYSRRCVAYWEDGKNKIPPAVELLMLIFRERFVLIPSKTKHRFTRTDVSP